MNKKRKALRQEAFIEQAGCCKICGDHIELESHKNDKCVNVASSYLIRYDYQKSNGRETVFDVRLVCPQCNMDFNKERQDYYAGYYTL